MSWPVEISTGLVVGRFAILGVDIADGDNEPEAIPASGKVKFTASTAWWRVPSQPMVLGAPTITCDLNEDGEIIDGDGTIGVRLPATDDPDLDPSGFTWRVAFQIDGVVIPEFHIALASGATVDLALVVPSPSPGPSGPTMVGIPAGGTPGQVLAKVSGVDFDVAWITGAGGGGVTDHGALSGLDADDHQQYALADGTRGAFAATSHTHDAGAITSGTVVAARLPAATTSASGIVELATTAETTTGTDTTRAVTAAGVKAVADTKAALSHTHTTLGPLAPIVDSTTARTLTQTDHGRHIDFTATALVTVTLPTDATANLTVGTEAVLFAAGAGGLTLATTGVTLLGNAPKVTVAQNQALHVQKTAANTWRVLGGTS